MALEKEAPQAGGRVVGLLGNHEVMNIMGDLRYVTPLNYASYAGSNSEARQKAAYDEFEKWKASSRAPVSRAPAAHGVDGSRVDGPPSGRVH